MKLDNESGFTFIELLIVMIFLAVLSGLTVVRFNGYKKRAYATLTSGDLRNAMASLETYVQDNNEYTTCNKDTCKTTIPAVKTSSGVQMNIIGNSDQSFVAITCHEKGEERHIFTGIPGLIVTLKTGPCGT